ncbi:MAG: hypothetical protein IJ262_07370 [Clostridia bacterium]|nr:hypothetical protein [Clostridia bacterium]
MLQKLIDEKKYDPKCEYCRFGRVPDDRKSVLCSYKGIMQLDDSCRKFKYDPLKRIPTKIKIDTDFSENEFKL